MAQVRAAFGCCAERRSVRRSTSNDSTLHTGRRATVGHAGTVPFPRSRRVIGPVSVRPSSSQSSVFAQSASSLSCGQVLYARLPSRRPSSLSCGQVLHGRLPSRRPSSLSCGQVLYRGCLRDALLRCLAGRCFTRGCLLLLRRTNRDSSPGTLRRSRVACGSARSGVRTTEDREGPRAGNEDGLVTRRPLNCDHATPDVGDDAASGRLVHLGAHHLNLVTDFWHETS